MCWGVGVAYAVGEGEELLPKAKLHHHPKIKQLQKVLRKVWDTFFLLLWKSILVSITDKLMDN